jgi:hypothetical protein
MLATLSTILESRADLRQLLTDATGHEDAEIRGGALVALGLIGGSADVRLLLEATQDDAVSDCAIVALGCLCTLHPAEARAAGVDLYGRAERVLVDAEFEPPR